MRSWESMFLREWQRWVADRLDLGGPFRLHTYAV